MPRSKKLLKSLLQKMIVLAVGFAVFCFLFGNDFWLISPTVHQKLQVFQLPLFLPEGEDGPIPVGMDIIDAETGWVIESPEWLSDNVLCKPVLGKEETYEREIWFANGKGQETPWVRTFRVNTNTYRDTRVSGTIIEDKDLNSIEYVDSKGNSVWTVNAPYKIGYSDETPAIQSNKGILLEWYACNDSKTSEYGLLCLDRGTGNLVWNVKGAYHNVFVADEQVFVKIVRGYRGDEIDKAFIAALRLEDGSEMFRFEISPELEVTSIKRCGNYSVAYGTWEEYCVIFDSSGKVIDKLQGEFLDAQLVDDDVVVLTQVGLTKYDSRGNIVWHTSELEGGNMGGGSLQLLPNGDLLGMSWGGISADEELVARISSEDGTVIWSAKCGGHVTNMHSAYWHYAHIESRGDYFFVIGQGMHGHTVTVLNKETGSEKRRWMYRTARW